MRALLTFCCMHYLNAKSFYINTNGTVSVDAHLKLEHVMRLCSGTDDICRSGDVNLCAVRFEGRAKQYADYENSCYLFMNNMCKNPGREYSIVSSGSCEQYKSSRRNGNKSTNAVNRNVSSTAAAVRSNRQMSTLYSVDTAFDYHSCPLSCPDTYEPVCVSVNRGSGKYFKFLTFVNHCSGDLYYCKHWQEFSPPPNEDENVVSSKLGWSFCGSSRYLQFARFAEVTSSMGHYGWLAGNYKCVVFQTRFTNTIY